IVTLVPLQRSEAVGGSKAQEVPHSKVRFGAQTMMGGVVSTTVTICMQVLVLPQLSVATQVRVALKVFPHRALVTVVSTVTVTLVPLPPVVVGGSKVHDAPHSTVLLDAHVITGGLVLMIEQV